MANIALVFDADYTLMDGYHPSVVLAKRNIPVDEFWKMVVATQSREREKGEKTNTDIIYLAHFMHEIRNGKLKGLTIKELEKCGKDVDKMLYPGVPAFFDDIKSEHPGCRISHNIVSVGIRHILAHSALGPHVDEIFGYTFFDDLTEGDEIDEIRSTSSSSEKVPAVVAISYGKFNDEYEFPISNMVYVGDGQTDKPAFRFVRKRGGLAICVYDPNKEGAFEKAKKLKSSVHFIVPANYERGSALWHVISNFIKSREPIQLKTN